MLGYIDTYEFFTNVILIFYPQDCCIKLNNCEKIRIHFSKFYSCHFSNATLDLIYETDLRKFLIISFFFSLGFCCYILEKLKPTFFSLNLICSV